MSDATQPEPAAVTLVSFSCDLAAVTADVGRGVPPDEAVERNVRETWFPDGKPSEVRP